MNSPMHTPLVSLVIPTYNRLETLQRVLAAIDQQTYPLSHLEVVVVADGATDGTNDYLQSVTTCFALRAIMQENQGVAAARNRGIAAAAGEIILFLDDDVVPTPQLVAEHVRLQQAHRQQSVVLGPLLTPPDYPLSPWIQWEQAMLSKQYADMVEGRWVPTARQFYTGNTSLPRTMLLSAGGFDPRFRRAEDVELAYRLEQKGIAFHFSPQAVGYHYAQRSFAAWLTIPYEYGRNDVIFTYEKGQSWLLPAIWREFKARHPAIRIVAGACLDRPRLSRYLTDTLRRMAESSDPRLAQAACSALFNLRHYQGIADQLGGRSHFFAGVRSSCVALAH